MNYKKYILLLFLISCILFSVSSVAASDANDTAVASENEQQIMEQENDDLDLSSSSQEDLISSEDTPLISQSNDNNVNSKSLEQNNENVISKSSELNVVSASSSNSAVKSDAGTTSKKTTKSTLIVSAPKVTNVYKKKGTFKVTVKDKKTKKPVKGIKLKIKVYTDKKCKIYSVKTNKKGIAKINTKSLSKGKHKVIVTIKATKKYKAKKVKSSIKIKAKSSSNKNGKLSTSIEADYTLTWKSKETVHRYSYGTFSTYTKYPYIKINPTLKGADGKKISGEYEATVYYYTGDDNHLLKTDTFKGKYGEYTYYSGTPSGWHYKVVIKYNGNSKYASSQFSRYI